VRHAGLSFLRVKFLLLVRLLVCHIGLLGLLQRVTSLVLLLHPVDEQHDQEGSEEGSHHTTHDHRCNTEKRAEPSVQIVSGDLFGFKLGFVFCKFGSSISPEIYG